MPASPLPFRHYHPKPRCTEPRASFSWRSLFLNLLLILLVLTGHTLAYSQENGGGEFRLRALPPPGFTAADDLPPLPATPAVALLKHTDVDIEVNGIVARVVIRQSFKNTTPFWVEGEYLFPLSEKAAVDYLAMEIGERKIVGKIREKQEARKIYDTAKKDGKKTTLLEQQRQNLFTSKVANIAPGEDITVELHYVETLDYSMDEFSLTVPTTVTPRYLPQDWTQHGWQNFVSRLADAVAITPPMKPAAEAPPLTLHASIDAGVPLTYLNSPHHEFHNTRNNNSTRYQLTLDSGAVANRDVVLQWQPDTGEFPAASVFQESLSQDNGQDSYLLFMLTPPQTLTEQQQLSRETIFVIDISGSMSGVSIRQAREALLTGIRSLKPSDRFNIVAFNNRYFSLWPDAVPANTTNLNRATQQVQSLTAGGGTEMAAPLAFALDGTAPEGYLRQVIFITDGSVGNEEQLITLIERERDQSRLFPVGIGSAPNRFFMRSAAEAGQGSFTYIGSQAEVASAMSELFYKIESPVMTNIRLDFGSQPVHIYPQKLPDLYAGEPLTVAIKSTGSAPDYVLVHGDMNGRVYREHLDLTGAADANAVSKLWARRKLHHLYDTERKAKARGIQADGIKADITRVALTHQLMSPHTSFVAVEEESSRPLNQMLKKIREANPMPAGNTMAIPLPAGALGIKQLWLTGLVCLVLCLLFTITGCALSAHRNYS